MFLFLDGWTQFKYTFRNEIPRKNDTQQLCVQTAIFEEKLNRRQKGKNGIKCTRAMEAYIISAYELCKFHIQWSYLPPHNILNVAEQKKPCRIAGDDNLSLLCFRFFFFVHIICGRLTANLQQCQQQTIKKEIQYNRFLRGRAKKKQKI